MRTTRENINAFNNAIPTWFFRLIMGGIITIAVALLTTGLHFLWDYKLDTNRFVIDSVSHAQRDITSQHMDSLMHEVVRLMKKPPT